MEEARLISRAILSILAGLPLDYVVELPSISEQDSTIEIPLFRGTIQSWSKHQQHTHIICLDEFQREVHFKIQAIHESCHTLWHGATIHIMNCVKFPE